VEEPITLGMADPFCLRREVDNKAVASSLRESSRKILRQVEKDDEGENPSRIAVSYEECVVPVKRIKLPRWNVEVEGARDTGE